MGPGDGPQQCRFASTVGPTKAKISPLPIRKEASFTAVNWPWRTSRFSMASCVIPASAPNRLQPLRGLSSLPSGSPSAIIRPASMQIMRSATCSKTCTMCSIHTMLMPRLAQFTNGLYQLTGFTIRKATTDFIQQQDFRARGQGTGQLQPFAIQQTDVRPLRFAIANIPQNFSAS